jgi:hypothetical protein
MTDDLIEISDKFIAFFIKENGVRKDKELFDFIKDESINIELLKIINVLVTYKIIERSNTDAGIKFLTPDGFKAAKIGIKKYIEEIEYDKALDRSVKVATIKTSRWAIGISILSLFISIVVPILIEKQKNEVPSKTEIQNMIDNNNSNRDSTNYNCNFK